MSRVESASFTLTSAVEKKNRNLILDAFPLRYIKMLEKIGHVDWHTAYFSGFSRCHCARENPWMEPWTWKNRLGELRLKTAFPWFWATLRKGDLP
jgi:hypothetical protein